MFIDTHTHIYTDDFSSDCHEVIERAICAGTLKLLLPNIDAASIRPMLALCEKYPNLCFPMMGLHPTELPNNPQPILDKMEKMLEEKNNPYVAIGEVGIDLYWDSSRREDQIKIFHRQVEWAMQYNLPIMIHSRAAHRDLVNTLKPFANSLMGVFHCFGGTNEEANELLSIFPNFVLGIGGTVTFKKSKLPAVLNAEVPLNRIVVETDAPYLAPSPHRGERNEPSFIPFIIEKLADIYSRHIDEIENILLNNTLRVFPKLSL